MYLSFSLIQRLFFDAIRRLLPLVFCGAALSLPLTSIAKEAPSCKAVGPIIFGILPFISTEQLVIQFSPIAQYISTYLQVPVRVETAPDFAAFARRTNDKQRYDILFTAPHLYSQAHNKADYRLIAGVDSPGMWAVIVVPRQSKIQSINDLRGKRLATAHPTSLATLLVRKHLTGAGIDPDRDLKIISTPSNDASLLSSFHGVTDASALMQPPYAATDAQIKDNMRIIAKTASTPHIPISVSPRISASCADQISRLLLQMATTNEGKAALQHNNFSGFKKVQAQDYSNVIDLNDH